MNNVNSFRKVLYKDFDDRKEQFKQGKFNLAHYTSSKTATNILKNNQIWLCNVQYMNDYSEISNGIDLFNNVIYNSKEGKLLCNALNKISPNMFNLLVKALEKIKYKFMETYVFCLTEFNNEDTVFGRLSMWRAYANKDGVALVFNNKILQDIPNIDFLSMYYFDENDLQKECYKLASEIEKNYDSIRQIPLQELINLLFTKIAYSYLSLKHKAFSEEREWRVLYNSCFMQNNNSLELSLENCFDTPRFVYKFDLEKAGLKIDDILEKILIGPSNNSKQLRDVFIKILKDKGIANAEERVICTNIPLRC